MRLFYFPLLLIFLIVISSCNKVKKMPETVYVTWVDANAVVDIQTNISSALAGSGPSFVISNQYADPSISSHELNGIRKQLSDFFKKKNVEFTENATQANYLLELELVQIHEDILPKNYSDTCQSSNSYLFNQQAPLSSVDYKVHVSLHNSITGLTVGSYYKTHTDNEELWSSEGCGSPSISQINLWDFRDEITESLRNQLCNAIYIDMGF